MLFVRPGTPEVLDLIVWMIFICESGNKKLFFSSMHNTGMTVCGLPACYSNCCTQLSLQSFQNGPLYSLASLHLFPHI